MQFSAFKFGILLAATLPFANTAAVSPTSVPANDVVIEVLVAPGHPVLSKHKGEKIVALEVEEVQIAALEARHYSSTPPSGKMTFDFVS